MAFSSKLPSNVEFHKLDITQSFPFEDETFDIIHARLVLMHVSACDFRTRKRVTHLSPLGAGSEGRPTSRSRTPEAWWVDHRGRPRR